MLSLREKTQEFMVGTLIGGGLSALGSLFGGIRARKQARKAEKQLNNMKTENRKWWEQERGTDYLDTAEARSVLSTLRNDNRKQQQAMSNDVTRSGLSDEAKVAMAGQLNRNYSENVNQLAGMGTQYKNDLRREYRARDDQYNAMLYNTSMNKANSASALGNAFSSAGMLFTSDAFSELTDKIRQNKQQKNR